MTTPNPGSLPSYGEHGPEGTQSPNPQDTPSGYPAYPAQSSLGDQYAQFEVNTAASMAGSNALRYHGQQLADGLYGNGTEPHPINDPVVNGWMHTKGTGRLRIGEAISWAFKAFVANPKPMLIIGVVTAVLNVLSSSPTSPPLVGILAGLAMLFIMPVLVSAVLQQTLVRTFSKMQAPAYGKTIGLLLLLTLIGSIAMTIVITIGALASTIDVDSLPNDPDMMLEDPFMIGEFGRVFGITLGLAFVAGLLLAPFVLYPLSYAADNNRTFGYALGEGIKAGARNYLPTLGLAAILLVTNALVAVPTILALSAAIPMVLGTVIAAVASVVVTPFSLLAVAHAYRQVSGGPVPHEVSGAQATATTTTDTPAV